MDLKTSNALASCHQQILQQSRQKVTTENWNGQQLRSFSKPAQSAPGIFSRAERQLVIASSTETAADRERASFIANAVLYRTFSVLNPRQYELVSKIYYSNTDIDSFHSHPDSFRTKQRNLSFQFQLIKVRTGASSNLSLSILPMMVKLSSRASISHSPMSELPLRSSDLATTFGEEKRRLISSTSSASYLQRFDA